MNKSNKEFMIFSAINIIFVVDAHAWTALNLMTRYLSYNMFFMQAFIFISGYFFVWRDDLSITKYIVKKIKKLMIPYYVWWFLYALFLWLLYKFANVKIGADITLHNLILGPWEGGECWNFSNPSWFVCCLFLIQILYIFVHYISKRFWNDWIALMVFIVISVYTTNYVTVNSIIPQRCNFYRVAILLCFYQIGVVYRKYLEKYVKKLSGIAVCTVILAFIAIYAGIYGWNEFYFNSLSWSKAGMEQFGLMAGMRPIITGVVGILFWLKISQALVSVLENNRFVNFISNHTFEIMFNHIVFIWIVNLILVKLNNKIVLAGFDMVSAINDPWYRWCDSSWSNLMYFLAGLFGALAVAWISDYVKRKIRDIWDTMHRKMRNQVEVANE